MHLLSSLPLLLLGSSIAAAAAIPEAIPQLDESHLIIYGQDGRVEVVDKATYLASNLATSPLLGPNVLETSDSADAPQLSKRCKSATIIRENKDIKFTNWDVPMSSVVQAGEANATVTVTKGYQIANSIAVAEGADLTWVKDFLSTSYTITYTQTWTSTYSSEYRFTLPAGKYGVIVSNPNALRKSGYVDTGCVGEGRSSYYQADSYESHAYGGLSWVTGTISLCVSDKYPVPMCQGDGVHE